MQWPSTTNHVYRDGRKPHRRTRCKPLSSREIRREQTKKPAAVSLPYRRRFIQRNNKPEPVPGGEQVRTMLLWWTRRGSNPRPPRCERGALPRGAVICDTNRGVKMSKPVVKNQKQKKNSVCLCNIKWCSLLKTQHIEHLFYYGIAVLGM